MRDGDEYVVNGQKVWTTVAHLSKWGMLVARTNPDVPKHDGLSYFVLDMESPGVEVRPLYQITGEAEFNEVFFDDVRIPAENRLGKEGQGWRVAITTLMNERVAIGGGGSKKKGGGAISKLVELWKERDPASGSAAQNAILRDRVTRSWIEQELLRLTTARAASAAKAGNPGPEGSVAKLFQAESAKRMWEVAIDVLGPKGLSFEEGYELRQAAGMSDGVGGLREVPVPALARELDRGRHQRDHEEHPRRTRPRPARRSARRQGRGLEGRAAQLARASLGTRNAKRPRENRCRHSAKNTKRCARPSASSSPTDPTRQAVREQMASDTRLRRERLEADGRAGRAHGPDHPRGEHGGAGYGYRRARHRGMEEMGRALLCAPFLSTRRDGDQRAAPRRERRRAEGAAARHRRRLDPRDPRNRRSGLGHVAGVAMQAQPKDDGYTLDGTKQHVVDGGSADVILVAWPGRAPAIELFRVDADAAGPPEARFPSST